MATATLRKTISLKVSADFYKHLEVISKKENRSLNNYIETALLQFSNYYNPKKVTVEEYDDSLMSKEDFFAMVDKARASKGFEMTKEELKKMMFD